jgi:hypothetical protein
MADNTAHRAQDAKRQAARMIENQEEILEALLQKAQQMLMYPLAQTTRTTTDDGKQITTEVHPAKWSMADALKFYSQALELLENIEALRAHADQLDRMESTDDLPAWVPAYLAAWGGERPNGRRMTVTEAAEMAGTTDSNVRNLRQRSEQFRRMEWMARHGDMDYVQSMVDAGLRGSAITIFESFMHLVKGGDRAAILKGMEWIQDKPIRIKLDENDGLSDEERAERVMDLLDAARARRDGNNPQK